MMSKRQSNHLGRKWTLEEDIKMCKLRDKGYTFKEIGEILNRSEKACATRYSNQGYTLNPLKLLLGVGFMFIAMINGIITEPTTLFQ